MKYNFKKNSKNNMDLTDDKSKKAVTFDEWRNRIIGLLEAGNLDLLQSVIKENIMFREYQSFLISILGVIQSIYGNELYLRVLDIIKNSNPNLKEKINE